jgi:hypothetical protein
VSSNPIRYLYACWTLNFHLVLAWNQVISVDPERAKGVMLSKLFDSMVSFVAMLAVTIAFLGWLLVIAPIQHIRTRRWARRRGTRAETRRRRATTPRPIRRSRCRPKAGEPVARSGTSTSPSR